jgi:hypothetical protein
MPDYDLIAAPFPDRHVTAAFASIVAPTTIVIAIVITTLAVDSVSVTTVRSDAEVQLSKGNFGFGNIPSGVRRQSPHYARDGGDKRQFSHSNLLLCQWRYG